MLKNHKRDYLFLMIFLLLSIIVFLLFDHYFGQPFVSEEISDITKSVIIVTETEKEKLVKNTREGLEIKVPKDWQVVKQIKGENKMKIFWYGPKQGQNTYLLDGLIFEINCYKNKQNLSLKKWVEKEGGKNTKEVKINNQKFIKTIENLSLSKDKIETENGQVVSYFFKRNNNQICKASCTVAGDNYLNYSQECENRVFQELKY